MNHLPLGAGVALLLTVALAPAGLAQSGDGGMGMGGQTGGQTGGNDDPPLPGTLESGLGSTRGPRTLDPSEETGSFTWRILWEVDQEQFLERRRHVFGEDEGYRDDGFFLGRGERRQVAHSGRSIPPGRIKEAVLPLLEDALEKDRSSEVQAAAALALARAVRTQPSETRAAAVARLRPLLADSNRDVSEAATIALGLTAHWDAIVDLGALLLDDEDGRALVGGHEVPYRQRAYAAYGLGLAAGDVPNEDVRRFAVQKLFAGAEADRGRWRDLEVACVIAVGMVPLEDGGGALAGDDSASASSSLEGTLRALLALVLDERRDRLARGHAVTALGRLVTELSPPRREAFARELVPPIAALLGRGTRAPAELTQGAAWALGALLDDDDDETSALGRRALLRVFDLQDDILTQAFALVALARSGARPGLGRSPGAGLATARRELLSTLARGDTSLRTWAAFSIGILGYELRARGVEVPGELRLGVRTALRETESPDEASSYAVAAGLLGDIAAEPLARRYVTKSRNDVLRSFGSVSVGLLGSIESLPALDEALREALQRPPLLEPVALGRALLDDPSLVRDVESALSGEGSQEGRLALLFALGRTGDVRALEPLLRWAEPHATASEQRAVAIAALGMLVEPDALPWPARIAWEVNPYATTETLRGSGRGVLDAR